MKDNTPEIKWYEKISVKITALVMIILLAFAWGNYWLNNRDFNLFSQKVNHTAENRVSLVRGIVSEQLARNGESIMENYTKALFFEQLSYLEKSFLNKKIESAEELIRFCMEDKGYLEIISRKFMSYGYATLSIYREKELILTYHEKKEILGKDIFKIVDSLSPENQIKQNVSLFKNHWKEKKSGGIYYEQTGSFLPEGIPEKMKKKYAYQFWGKFRNWDLVVETTTYIQEFQCRLELIQKDHQAITHEIKERSVEFIASQKKGFIIFISGMFIALLTIMIYFNRILIVKPVKRILDALQRYAKNDFSDDFCNCTTGELGLIQKSSGIMANTLEKTLNSLQELNASLEEKVEERTLELKQEQEKSEKLLLNILPPQIALKLKKNTDVIAEDYAMVTVLFTDFKGFTTISESVLPERLVRELNEIFGYFDELCGQFRMEKIKTIGDAYMACGGLPEKNETHPVDSVRLGLKMIEFIEKRKSNPECLPFEIRVGIHSGPLIAGVIGKKKFTYDIWGDTVNIASRMESASEPGKITVSPETCALIRHQFSCKNRGEIEIKGKGKMQTFFVEKEITP